MTGIMASANRAGFSPRRKQMLKVSFGMLLPAMMEHPFWRMILRARGTRTNDPILGILDRINYPAENFRIIPENELIDLREYLERLLAGLNEIETTNSKDKNLINAIQSMLAALDMAEGGRKHRRAAKSHRRRRNTKRRSTRRRA